VAITTAPSVEAVETITTISIEGLAVTANLTLPSSVEAIIANNGSEASVESANNNNNKSIKLIEEK
jgi:hypothetical protein